jgi:putative proteasome-type protease
MTYCLAIRLHAGLVLASDSRTSAGLDQINVYSKLHVFDTRSDRVMVLLSAGNLATTQAVINRMQLDMEDPHAERHLNAFTHLFQAADYVGEISRAIQARYEKMSGQAGFSPEATFILAGQIGASPHNGYLVYPQGNYISVPESAPFVGIGETKYGKPVLDRLVTPEMSIEDAARIALVSMDSTMRSNLSVGPPIELLLYRSGSLVAGPRLCFDLDTPYYAALRASWGEALRAAFHDLPPLDPQSLGAVV